MADARFRSIADPFDAGPYARVQQTLGLLRRGTLRRDPWTERRRAVIFATIAWVPLILLSSLQSFFGGATTHSPLGDISVYARYLIALPLLLLGERLLLTRLSTIVKMFVTGGYVRQVDESRFEEVIVSTRRLISHPVAEIAIVLVAYGTAVATNGGQYLFDRSTWTLANGDGGQVLSWAGWWRALVSQPLFLISIGAWLWRAILWGRLLWLISRLDLVLVPAHPDLVAGLLFVSRSVPAYAPFAFALGVNVAGGVAQSVFIGGHDISEYSVAAGTLVFVVLATALCPLLPLMRPIRQAQLRGMLEYGELASRLGRRFDERWIRDRHTVTKDALSSPDFSSTVDLYGITANVTHIRLLPVDFRAIVALVVAALLPLLPVGVASLPVGSVLHFGAKLLL
jgi:hypothetical protein